MIVINRRQPLTPETPKALQVRWRELGILRVVGESRIRKGALRSLYSRRPCGSLTSLTPAPQLLYFRAEL
uniref:SFRICE_036344 n=1 Tax=Spodoptera frugiperda TaxID=7108 RepID=A0A2H1W5K4_SPOFR